MTLQRQTISIPIGSGQTDDKTRPLVEGNEEARNFSFPRTGLAAKRAPHGALPTTGLSSGTINSVHDSDGVPIALVGTGVRAWSPVDNEWFEPNATAPIPSLALIDPLVRGGEETLEPDSAILDDVLCCVWRQDGVAAGTWCAFYDVRDGRLDLLSGPTQIVGLTGTARIVAIDSNDSNSRFVVVGRTSSSAFGVTSYTVSSGTYTFGTVSALLGVSASNSAFDLVPAAGRTAAYFCWNVGTPLTRFAHIDSTGTITTRDFAANVQALLYDEVGDRLIAFGVTGSVVVMTGDFGGGWSAGTWSSVVMAPGAPQRCVVARWDATNFALLYSDRWSPSVGGAAHQWGTKVEVRGPSGLTLGSGLVPNAIILAKSQYVSDLASSIYVLATPWGGRGFLAKLRLSGGSVVPQVVTAFSQTAVSAPTMLPHLMEDSNGALFCAYSVATDTSFQGFRERTDVVRARVSSVPPIRSVDGAGLRITASGAGVCGIESRFSASLSLVETDAPIFPNVKVPGAHPNTGTTGSDVIGLVFAWVWIDQQGNERRARPSVMITPTAAELQGTAADSPPNQSWMILIPWPTLAEPLSSERGTALYLDCFMSEANDTSIVRWIARVRPQVTPGEFEDAAIIYFGSASSTTPTHTRITTTARANNIAAYQFAKPAWYESELEPSPPAAVIDIVSTQSRLWALSAERRSTVLATKPIARGYAPEFAAEIEITVPSEGGDCVGLAALDDKIIVFKERRIFVITGDPGDSFGNGSTLQKPRLISGDVGCICTQSIVEGPFGIAFQSQRGFYVLDRGLSLRFVGDKVQGQSTTEYRFCGMLVPHESAVRWLAARTAWAATWTPENFALTWDFLRDQWSLWQPYTATHHALVGGVVHRASSTQVSEEFSDGDFSGSDSLVSLKSAWIKVAGLSGFQRVWRIAILLRHYTGHVKAEVFYDYSSFAAETKVWLESEMVALRGSNTIVTLSIRPEQQKCSAIQIRLSELTEFGGDNPILADQGQGFEPISIDLEVGVKSGTYRRALPATTKR